MPFCTRSLGAVVVALLAGACAGTHMGQSGFLDDYSTLEPADQYLKASIPDDMLLYVHPEVHERGYDAVMIDPVVHVPLEGTKVHADEEDVEHLTRAFEERLRIVLGEEYEIVEEPRPGAVRIRAAITEADPSWVWLNVVGVILIVPPDMGGISAEIEVLDAMTGERLIAMTARRDGTVFLLIECFMTWGHARHGMKKWSHILRRILDGSDEPDETEEGAGDEEVEIVTRRARGARRIGPPARRTITGKTG